MMYCVIGTTMICTKCLQIKYLKLKAKAIEFKDKQKQFRKAHDARAVEFDYKYFKGERR